jgi:hypothetical protein
MIPSPLARPGWLLLAGLLMVGALRAAEGGFSATLSTGQKNAAGLAALSAAELTALDQLVADDLAYARRENLTALEGAFVARQAEAGRKSAGLDRLTPEQQARLNALVAAAITARPTPKERPRLKDSDVLVKNQPQVHGSVTVAYGWGAGGRSMRAGSMWLDYYDPESHLGIGVGLSTVNGSYPGYYPGYYPGFATGGFYPDYSDPRYYTPSATYYDASYRGDSFRSSFQGDGACFRAGPSGGFGGRGGRHP